MTHRIGEWLSRIGYRLGEVVPWMTDYRSATEDAPDPETITLAKVTWEEVVTETYTEVTERLFWSGGAEQQVTYTLGESDIRHGHYLHRHDNGDVSEVLIVDDPPTGVKPVHEREREIEETRRRTAWVEEDMILPDVAEPTGETKEVVLGE